MPIATATSSYVSFVWNNIIFEQPICIQGTYVHSPSLLASCHISLGTTTYDKLNAFMSWCLPSLDGDIKTLEIILTRNKNVIMLTSSRKNQKQTKHGRQLWGSHFGHFHDIYVKYVSTNCIAFNFGFTFDVWAWYFDFHKVNYI